MLFGFWEIQLLFHEIMETAPEQTLVSNSHLEVLYNQLRVS